MPEMQNILIVDDDPEWRRFLADTLSEHYAVRVAVTGEAGLQLARQVPPAAIVLDVIMPGGMDGFGVLCKLREDPATRAIPVVMLTSVNAQTPASREASSRYRPRVAKRFCPCSTISPRRAWPMRAT